MLGHRTFGVGAGFAGWVMAFVVLVATALLVDSAVGQEGRDGRSVGHDPKIEARVDQEE